MLCFSTVQSNFLATVYSSSFFFQIRLWQCIGMFIQVLPKISKSALEKINELLWDIVTIHNHRSVRLYIEVFAVNFLVSNTQFILSNLERYVTQIFRNLISCRLLNDVNARAFILRTTLTISAYTILNLDLSVKQHREIANRVRTQIPLDFPTLLNLNFSPTVVEIDDPTQYLQPLEYSQNCAIRG